MHGHRVNSSVCRIGRGKGLGKCSCDTTGRKRRDMSVDLPPGNREFMKSVRSRKSTSTRRVGGGFSGTSVGCVRGAGRGNCLTAPDNSLLRCGPCDGGASVIADSLPDSPGSPGQGGGVGPGSVPTRGNGREVGRLLRGPSLGVPIDRERRVR